MVNHSNRAHATLSASSAHRWLHCPPSANLEAKEPNTSSLVAQEGTTAHEVAETYLRYAVGDISAQKRTAMIKKISKTDLYSADMIGHAKDYIDYILSKRTGHDYEIAVEQRLDFSKYVPNGFGTGDCLLIQDGTLSVIDFKYGHNPVDADHNPQMMLYALGAIEVYDMLYDFDTIEMCIYQPRIHNISEFSMTASELRDWANKTLKPIAKLANSGAGETCAGSHCLYCKVKTRCKTLADYNLEAVKSDFEDEEGKLNFAQLSQSDKAMILSRAKDIKAWLKDIETACTNELLEGGSIEGYKIVEGRANRKYSNSSEVANALKDEGYGEEIYKPRELITLTNLQKVAGVKTIKTLTDKGLIVKPEGAPSIVPSSDKRPEYKQAIKNDFEKLEER